MSFAILRTKKIKDATAVTLAEKHNLRKRYSKNVDPSKSHLNRILYDEFNIQSGERNLSQCLTEYYKKKKVSQKKNSVQVMEFVLTASPEFFKKASPEKISAWVDHQMEFARKKFGDQIKFVVLHMDETSPHLHVMISTEQKSIKKYKNRYGETHKETWSLNVKRYDRGFLIDLQTEYAEHNSKFGLSRGMKNSNAVHQTLKEFYRKIEKAMSVDYRVAIKNALGQLKPNIFGLLKKDEVESILDGVLGAVYEQNKALKTIYQQDFKERISRLQKREKTLELKEIELKEKETELEAKREVYKEAINGEAFNLKKIRQLEFEKNEVEEENKRLKQKYEPKSKVNRFSKSSAFKLF